MAYSTEVLADTPLAYWRLGESSGLTMTDSSGNGRNGTYASGAALPTLGAAGLLVGDADTAASFDGGDRASVVDGTWMDSTTIVLEAWVKQTTTTGNQQILYRDNTNFSGANMRYWHLRVSGGVPIFTFWASDGGVQQNVVATTTLVVGTKYHIVGSYDGTTGRIFVNDVEEATVSISGAIQSSATGATIHIGSNGSSEFFSGTLDELAMYTTLAGSRVSVHYTAGTSEPVVEAVTATATAQAHAPSVEYGYTIEAVTATATAQAHAPTVGAAVAPPTSPRRNLARLAVRVGNRHITREVSGLQFRKEAIGGLQSMEFRLSRPLDRFDVDLAHLSKVYIYDARSAATIAEGRLYDFGRSASASDGQQWDIVAFGPAQHASDITRPLIYIDRDLSRWERLTGSKRASRTEVDADGATEDDSALLMEFPEGTTLATNDTAMMVYRACEEAGMQIGAVAWTWDAGATNANYEVRLTTGTSGTTLGSNDLTATFDTAGGTMTAWTVDTFPTGRTRVTARIYYTGGGGATPADRWATFENVRVLGRRMDKTGTLVSGSAGMTASGRVLISQVVNDIVGRMLPEFDGANASIDTSGAYEIDQLAYPDGATAEQVLDDCMALDPAFRWYAGPDVTGDGYSFTFAPWPTTVRYEVTLEGGGSFPTSAQELFNEVSVRWRTARGKTRSTLVTGACPILDDAGITRRALIDLSDETGSSANATQAGTNFLADHRVPKNAGTLTIRQPIRDLTTGRMVDPFEIEPGELIRVRGIESYADALNASSNDGLTVFRINAMSYSSDENAAQLELDSDARTTSNALRRLAKRRNRKR